MSMFADITVSVPLLERRLGTITFPFHSNGYRGDLFAPMKNNKIQHDERKDPMKSRNTSTLARPYLIFTPPARLKEPRSNIYNR